MMRIFNFFETLGLISFSILLSLRVFKAIFSERLENPCKDCNYFRITEKDFGCDFDGPCPYDREPDGGAES